MIQLLPSWFTVDVIFPMDIRFLVLIHSVCCNFFQEMGCWAHQCYFGYFFFLNRYKNFRTLVTPQPAQLTSLALDSSGEVVVAGAMDPFEVTETYVILSTCFVYLVFVILLLLLVCSCKVQ